MFGKCKMPASVRALTSPTSSSCSINPCSRSTERTRCSGTSVRVRYKSIRRWSLMMRLSVTTYESSSQSTYNSSIQSAASPPPGSSTGQPLMESCCSPQNVPSAATSISAGCQTRPASHAQCVRQISSTFSLPRSHPA